MNDVICGQQPDTIADRTAENLLVAPHSETVPLLLRARAQTSPHRLALSARSARGFRDRLSYAQLVARMDAVAHSFRQLGVHPGDRLAVLLTNDAGREGILTALGTLALGAVIVPLNTRSSDDELAHALALVEPSAVLVDETAHPRIAKLWPSALRMVVGQPPNGDTGAIAWPDPEGQPAVASVSAPTDPDALAFLVFTSGTTARAKAVMHTHRTMIATGRCCAAALDLTPSDLYQAGYPFFTSAGLNIGCLASWISGGGFVFEEPQDNMARLAMMPREGTTIYHGVPSIIHFMLQQFERTRSEGRSDELPDLSRLRCVAYGGAAMPGEVSDRIARAWPWVEQIQIYGMTESGPSGTVLPPSEMLAKRGSVGRAMPDCRITVLDDAGDELPAGATGEIAIESPAVATGYYRDPQATAAAFSGRRVRTGDVGYLDGDGFLFFTDRKKDIINRGGLKVSSVSVEDVLCRHPMVAEAAVVAAPHPDLGEDVAACIVPQPGIEPDIDAITTFCRDRLADYAVPRRWLVLDELPKNPMGKILKGELRRRFAPK